MSLETLPRVLVIDDDAETRKILTTALTRRPLKVDVAAGGVEAIDLLRLHAYGVVLLDLMMPDVDGFGVLDALAVAQAEYKPVVLVLTGASRAEIEKLDPQQIHGILRKPFDPLEVAAMVSACAEIRSRASFEKLAVAAMLGTAPLISLF